MEAIRIIFWAWVFLLCLQLVGCDGCRKYISLKKLNIGLVVNLLIVTGYVVWRFVFAKEVRIMPLFLDIVGYTMIYLLVFIVRRVYLPKIIEGGKIYRMTDLKAVKNKERECRDGDCYDIYGTIKEHGYSFNVLMTVGQTDYMRWHAMGMFDKASKSYLNVVLSDYYVKDDKGIAVVRVQEIRI